MAGKAEEEDTAADCGLRLTDRTEDLAWPGRQKKKKDQGNRRNFFDAGNSYARLSVFLSVSLFTCLSLSLSVCQSVSLSVCLTFCLSDSLYIIPPTLHTDTDKDTDRQTHIMQPLQEISLT